MCPSVPHPHKGKSTFARAAFIPAIFGTRKSSVRQVCHGGKRRLNPYGSEDSSANGSVLDWTGLF